MRSGRRSLRPKKQERAIPAKAATEAVRAAKTIPAKAAKEAETIPAKAVLRAVEAASRSRRGSRTALTKAPAGVTTVKNSITRSM